MSLSVCCRQSNAIWQSHSLRTSLNWSYILSSCFVNRIVRNCCIMRTLLVCDPPLIITASWGVITPSCINLGLMFSNIMYLVRFDQLFVMLCSYHSVVDIFVICFSVVDVYVLCSSVLDHSVSGSFVFCPSVMLPVLCFFVLGFSIILCSSILCLSSYC